MTAGGETLFGEWSDKSQGCAPWKQQLYKASLTLMDNVVVKKKLDQNWVSSVVRDISISGIQPNLSAIEAESHTWGCQVELIYKVYKTNCN